MKRLVGLCFGVLLVGATIGRTADPETPWRFASMPDFLNVDTEYPQPGWEGALSVILEAVKAEGPEFLLVAGDLVMGHWYTPEKIDACAARYYPAWIERLKAHGLRFYAAIGDHELGDNPWPPPKAALIPRYRRKFREYLKMPENGPDGLLGTAYWWRHREILFIAVDVFEAGKGPQGAVVPQVTGAQLEWFRRVVAARGDARYIVVMGHTPILGPVTAWSSSHLMLKDGAQSAFWQAMKEAGVDLYLCGEVHAITCREQNGIWQIAHGGLIGYNTRTNYLLTTVYPDRLELEVKEIDLAPSGPKLWQEGTNRPLSRVAIAPVSRERGFVPVGRLTIVKSDEKPVFQGADGYFRAENRPAKGRGYPPVFHQGKGPSAPPRVTLDESR